MEVHHHVNNPDPFLLISDDEEEEEEEDDDDDEDDDEDEEEDEDEDEEEVEEEVNPHHLTDPAAASRVSEIGQREKDAFRLIQDSEGCGEAENSQKEWNREDIEGLFCPICMEPWTSTGEHQPSCLTCGHLFGISCIKKWLGQRKNSGKCPQCNKECTLKDVRRIYGSRVVVVDEEQERRVRSLEAKCGSLEKKEEEWRKKEVEWQQKVIIFQKREAELCQKLQELTERTSILEHTLEEVESKSLSSAAGTASGFQQQSAIGHKFGLSYCPVSSYTFELQQELLLDGARYFNVDDTGQLLIIARRSTRIGGGHIITKMSLVSPHEQDDVLLPSTFKAVRDLHVSPFGRLALLASMGKKLSVLSMESNNIVLNYDLPAAAWSCSWDSNSSHYVHTGLQNGMLLVFDLRQTERPLVSMNGLTPKPIHTIYSLSEDSLNHSETKKLLTASSTGLYEWNIGGTHEGQSLISETADQEVCISLAYCPNSGNIVATFRPKVEMSDNLGISQVSQAPSSSMGYHVQGSHVFMQRVNSSYQRLGSTCTSVPGIPLPKYTIIGMGDGTPVFACGDEATSNLVLQELPSLDVIQCLQSHHHIQDVKHAASIKPSLLCCLSKDRMQFFSQKLL